MSRLRVSLLNLVHSSVSALVSSAKLFSSAASSAFARELSHSLAFLAFFRSFLFLPSWALCSSSVLERWHKTKVSLKKTTTTTTNDKRLWAERRLQAPVGPPEIFIFLIAQRDVFWIISIKFKSYYIRKQIANYMFLRTGRNQRTETIIIITLNKSALTGRRSLWTEPPIVSFWLRLVMWENFFLFF